MKGIYKGNPTFRLVLGMCPALAVSTSVENSLGMGLATTLVLLGSNIAISALRAVLPAKVRIPCYIIVIAGFSTIVSMLMEAFTPMLFERLGIFIPLIAVNCIVLGRAEAFASKHPVIPSIADALGMGSGFTLALMLIAAVREASGHIALLSILPPGGFIVLGLILAVINHIVAKTAQRHGAPPPDPVTLDCRHCTLCPTELGSKQ